MEYKTWVDTYSSDGEIPCKTRKRTSQQLHCHAGYREVKRMLYGNTTGFLLPFIV